MLKKVIQARGHVRIFFKLFSMLMMIIHLIILRKQNFDLDLYSINVFSQRLTNKFDKPPGSNWQRLPVSQKLFISTQLDESIDWCMKEFTVYDPSEASTWFKNVFRHLNNFIIKINPKIQLSIRIFENDFLDTREFPVR